MAQVIGIGGVFAASDDAAATQAWYRDVLGLPLEDWGGALFKHADSSAAKGKGALTVWSVFGPETQDYMKPGTARFMINFMVDDLDGMLARCKAHGVEPLTPEPLTEFNGRFAWVLDPDGVKVELWEPAVPPEGAAAS